MRVLAFSDMHRDLEAAASIVERSGEADLVVGAGDFAAVHEGLDEAIGALADVRAPLVLVPGNNETADALRAAAAELDDALVLHGDRASIAGLELFGLGAGIPTTPWDWSFDLSDEEAEAKLADCPAGIDLLVLHSPPRGHCDQSGGGDHLGSPALAAAIERIQPRVAVCGHIHEAWGAESEIGETAVYNLGPQARVITL